jgi:hypothetical protein
LSPNAQDFSVAGVAFDGQEKPARRTPPGPAALVVDVGQRPGFSGRAGFSGLSGLSIFSQTVTPEAICVLKAGRPAEGRTPRRRPDAPPIHRQA